MFALTFGQQEITPMAQMMSKKQQRLNYKQYCCSLKRSGDMASNCGWPLGLSISKIYHSCSK
jgi:hypothetical protein